MTREITLLLCSTPNLHTLPTELLLSIALSLDLPTAVSFARVARRLTGPAEHRIWRDLEIIDSTKIDVGYSTPENGPPSDAQISLVRALECEVQERLLDRYDMLKRSGNWRKWGIVESLRMTTQPGVGWDMAEIMECTGGSLRSLEILYPGRFTYLPSDNGKTLDQFLHLRIYEHGLGFPFPNLTTVILAPGAITYVEFVPVLCVACPLLAHLEFSIDEEENRLIAKRPGEIRRNRLLEVDTQLQILRVSYSRHIAYTDEDAENEEYDSFNTILSLLKHSPLITSLAIAHQPSLPFYEQRDSRIPVSIGKMANLKDLDCTAAEMKRVDFLLSEPVDLPCQLTAKRMLMMYSDWEIPSPLVGLIPTMPVLEVLFLNCSARWAGTFEPTSLLQPGYLYRLEPSALLWLRNTPRLHIIHFYRSVGEDRIDALFGTLPDLEQADLITCQIWSIRHGDDEIIHGRLKLYDVEEISDEPSGEKQRWRILYATGEASRDDLSTFAFPVSEPFYQELADYNGKDIPTEVMAKIREVEGVVADAEWKKRGLEVGGDAWQVLLDWEEGLNATTASEEP